MRLAFLESAKRGDGLFRDYPPSRIWVFSERITFYPSGVATGGSGTTAYAWFVWDKTAPSGTALGWIPTGVRAEHTRD
jgi:hypothetical protein